MAMLRTSTASVSRNLTHNLFGLFIVILTLLVISTSASPMARLLSRASENRGLHAANGNDGDQQVHHRIVPRLALFDNDRADDDIATGSVDDMSGNFESLMLPRATEDQLSRIGSEIRGNVVDGRGTALDADNSAIGQAIFKRAWAASPSTDVRPSSISNSPREPSAAKRALSLFAHWRTPYASSEDGNVSSDLLSAVTRGELRPVGRPLRWG